MRDLDQRGRTQVDSASVHNDASVNKFGGLMRRVGRVSPVVSSRWGRCNRRTSSVGPVQTRADGLRRPAGDRREFSNLSQTCPHCM
jgi:hypothetical protein